jgi:hypothetical protein
MKIVIYTKLEMFKEAVASVYGRDRSYFCGDAFVFFDLKEKVLHIFGETSIQVKSV